MRFFPLAIIISWISGVSLLAQSTTDLLSIEIGVDPEIAVEEQPERSDSEESEILVALDDLPMNIEGPERDLPQIFEIPEIDIEFIESDNLKPQQLDTLRRQLLFMIHQGLITLGKHRSTYSADEHLPKILLLLGQTYRSIGAYDLALKRFFNVPQAVSVIQLAGDLEEARRLSDLGTFNIALTHFIKGDYREADRSFRRILRIGGTPAQLKRAEFYAAQCQFLLGNYRVAIGELRQMLDRYPDDAFVAEARYLIARSQQILGNCDLALEQALVLLERESMSQSYDPTNWLYWQRKVGNQLANEFYESGEYLAAIDIYQNLVRLSHEITWQWPIIYQMGLCFEKLNRWDRSLEAYDYILQQFDKISPELLTPPIEEIFSLSEWRAAQIRWFQETDPLLKKHLLPTQTEDIMTLNRSL